MTNFKKNTKNFRNYQREIHNKTKFSTYHLKNRDNRVCDLIFKKKFNESNEIMQSK